jgi:hypothetical protein
VLDDDGTLWPKNPLAFQLAFIIDGLKRRALNGPTLTEAPTVRSVYFEPYVTNQHHRTPIPGTQTGQKKFSRCLVAPN